MLRCKKKQQAKGHHRGRYYERLPSGLQFLKKESRYRASLHWRLKGTRKLIHRCGPYRYVKADARKDLMNLEREYGVCMYKNRLRYRRAETCDPGGRVVWCRCLQDVHTFAALQAQNASKAFAKESC